MVDLSLKESSGLELIKDLQVRYPRLLVLVLSMRDESFYAERALRAGARGYVVKEEGGRTIIEAIRKVMVGQIYLSEAMASRTISRVVGGMSEPERPLVESLTDRELDVFELIGKGLPTRDIAKKLYISPKTVDSYRERLKFKLKLDSAAELLKHAIHWVYYKQGGQ